ncbi:MAG: antitoxin VapB family protein [Thermoproteota archaeon]
MWKSIKVKEETKKKLDKLKVHPRQSYDEVINRLIKRCRKLE